MFVLCLAIYYNKYFVDIYGMSRLPHRICITIAIVRMFIYLLMLGLTVYVNKHVATYVILCIIFIVVVQERLCITKEFKVTPIPS